MTVGSKLQETLASAESVKASLKTFSLDTQDQQAKQMYDQLAQNMTNIVNTLQARVNYVEQQEPQYKQQ
jgi:hypothetical protein